MKISTTSNVIYPILEDTAEKLTITLVGEHTSYYGNYIKGSILEKLQDSLAELQLPTFKEWEESVEEEEAWRFAEAMLDGEN